MPGPFCENNAAVWRCPLDSTRYPVEGLSFEFQPRVAGKSLDELRANKLGLPLSDIWLTYDFDPVHGSDPQISRNYLYADAHVECHVAHLLTLSHPGRRRNYPVQHTPGLRSPARRRPASCG